MALLTKKTITLDITSNTIRLMQTKGNRIDRWVSASIEEGLVEDGKADDPYCVVCHSTGFDEGGYKMGAPDSYNDKYKGVQCEECHGPGSDYMKNSIMKDRKKAIANGLKIPNEKHCRKCHDRKKYPWAKKFVYKDRLKKIEHTYSK